MFQRTSSFDTACSLTYREMLPAKRLFASMELYEALKSLLAMVDQMATQPRAGGGVLPADYGIAKGAARSALAKARGEIDE
jgi:hypothetical protein